MPLGLALSHFQSLAPLPIHKLHLFGCCSVADSRMGGLVVILWAPPMDSPVRLAVSPAAASSTGFYSQRF